MSNPSRDYASVFNVGIDRLQGKSDFYEWKHLVKSHFKRYDLWDVISGATPRPASAPESAAALTPEQELWDSYSRDGIAFLYYFVDKTIHATFEVHYTGPAMWKALMRRYDDRDADKLLKAFNVVSSLRYHEESAESFPDYLDSFWQHWMELVYRTADAEVPIRGSGNSLETALHVVATSEEAKIQFLIGSLPPSLWIEAMRLKLRRGKELTFMDLWSFLLSFHDFQERVARDDALAELQRQQCTWCSSRGFESGGHLWKGCKRLRKFNKKQQRQRKWGKPQARV